MSRPPRGVIAAVAVLSCLSAARADEASNTDRPDFVESSEVFGKGRFQLETGFGWERRVDSPGIKRKSASTPTLLRFGISDSVELRLETDGYSRTRSTRNGGSVVTFDVGPAYLLTKSMQIDVAASRGLTRQSPDLLLTAGLSIKF